ncbi:unnamed protein product [Rhizophagus irregularis]|uniref:RNA-directed RNA polymerase n=1 Tax=Rhizophagus irregularis TaxID=588596 RepID=A0A915ZJS4_9GLOM|nr:unnamed protein product [Rhizophagus irregularis]
MIEMMNEYAEKIKSEVIGCDNPQSLIAWVTNNSNIMRNRLEIFYNHYFENESSDDDCDLYVDSESESYTMSGFLDNPSEQFFIQLDREAGRDERIGLPFGIIEDDVILARNPCGLLSDIVKEDDISLATYLSGGNYDVDKIFCCWDPRIVKTTKIGT